MKISEAVRFNPQDQMTLQKAMMWLSGNYSVATHGIHMTTEVQQNGSNNTALLTLTVQPILHGWSKQAEVVIDIKEPINQLTIYTQVEAALLAALADQTN